MRRLTLHAQQRARLLTGKLQHLRALHHRLRKLELPGIDSLELGVTSGARGGPPVGWRAERLQMDIFDPRLVERRPKRRFRKAGPPRKRQRADVDHALDGHALQRRDELRDGCALITDGEDAHADQISIRSRPTMIGPE